MILFAILHPIYIYIYIHHIRPLNWIPSFPIVSSIPMTSPNFISSTYLQIAYRLIDPRCSIIFSHMSVIVPFPGPFQIRFSRCGLPAVAGPETHGPGSCRPVPRSWLGRELAVRGDVEPPHLTAMQKTWGNLGKNMGFYWGVYLYLPS
jgi:hypothetical protein